MSTSTRIVEGTEQALRSGDFDRARMLLGLALKLDSAAEAARVDA